MKNIYIILSIVCLVVIFISCIIFFTGTSGKKVELHDIKTHIFGKKDISKYDMKCVLDVVSKTIPYSSDIENGSKLIINSIKNKKIPDKIDICKY